MAVTPVDKAEHCKRTLGATESTTTLRTSYVYILVYFDFEKPCFYWKDQVFFKQNIVWNLF